MYTGKYRCLWSWKMASDSLELEIQVDVSHLFRCWGKNLGLLQESTFSLISELSFQSLEISCICLSTASTKHLQLHEIHLLLGTSMVT